MTVLSGWERFWTLFLTVSMYSITRRAYIQYVTTITPCTTLHRRSPIHLKIAIGTCGQSG